MESRAVLDDGEPQSGSADLLGMAFVHAVKALENTLFICLRHADAAVGNRKNCRLFRAGDLHLHGSFFLVVFDCVVTEIIQHFLDNDRNTLHLCRLALQCHLNALFLCMGQKLAADILSDFKEINRKYLFNKGIVVES